MKIGGVPMESDKEVKGYGPGKAPYRRALIKLSGEALAGEQHFGLEYIKIESIALQVKEILNAGIQTAIVVGGGNIWRGVAGSRKGMDRAGADYMGMLATCINSLALQDVFEANGVETRVLSAIEMRQIAEPYIRRRAIRHLEKGRVVIFAAGSGNPFFTTDTTAALRAAEIDADVILMAKNVDGVYDSDPAINPGAKKYEELTYMEALNQGLKVMDSTALSLCMDNHIPIVVFGLAPDEGNIIKAALGEKIGTTVGR